VIIINEIKCFKYRKLDLTVQKLYEVEQKHDIELNDTYMGALIKVITIRNIDFLNSN